MSAIIDGCVDILKVVNDTRTPEQIFDDYAKEKMMQPNRVVVGAQSVNQLYRNKKESSEAAA